MGDTQYHGTNKRPFISNNIITKIDMSPDTSHPSIKYGNIGLLIVNLGTVEDFKPKNVKKYLKQFLSDRRIIEISPFIWQPILRLIILKIRPKKTAAAYQRIWDTKNNESPLRHMTSQQAQLIQQSFDNKITVRGAMRYGTPSISNTIEEMQMAGCHQICVLALYPQYSATTSASAYDEVFRVLQKKRWQPTIRTSSPWYDNPIYIKALAHSVQNHIRTLNWQPDKMITSFHGLPQDHLKKGDPYYCHCAKTFRLLRETLALKENDMLLTFQSRFGFARWIQPDTKETVQKLAREGIKNIAIITPGFVSDCLETLEEVNISIRRHFIEAGGKNFTTIPCLNTTEQGINTLVTIAKKELAGWI